MVSTSDYTSLKDASLQFLTNSKYELTDIEKVMERVFGTKRSDPEAEEWSKYWQALCIYEEAFRDGIDNNKPTVCN